MRKYFKQNIRARDSKPRQNAMDTNTYTYIFLGIRISTSFQKQLLTGRVAIRSGINQRCVSVLYVYV
jgi:hypothetical protein